MAQNTDILSKINLNTNVPTALYYQLREEFRRLIREGHLRPGDRLPTVRAVGSRLGLSLFTVSRALSDLIGERQLVTRRGAGTFVASLRPPATEVIVVSEPNAARSFEELFQSRTVEALRKASSQPTRSFFVTYMDGHAPDAETLLTVSRARGVDSLVFYRPGPEMAQDARAVADDIPAVSLFYPVPESRVDCVMSDPASALRKMLLERVAAGRKVFIFAGVGQVLLPDTGFNPYAVFYHAFVATLKEAGVTPSLHVSMAHSTHEAVTTDLGLAARNWPAGAVLVASSPQLATRLDPSGKRFDSISYTESGATLRSHRGRVSLLYFDLGRAMEVGMRRLTRRGASASEQKIIRLDPEIVEASAGPALDGRLDES